MDKFISTCVFGGIVWLAYRLQHIPVQTPISPTELFLDQRKKQFHLFCETKNSNENVSDLLYDINFTSGKIDEMDKMEQEWKRRRMIDHTPQGNVLMYYDLYKRAFAYASDQQINYAILNACAMKYCRLYYCKDFFCDTSYSQVSPFSTMEIEALEKDKQKIKEKMDKIGINMKDAPFVVRKTTVVNIPTEFKNVFRNMGKLQNVAWIQPVPKIEKACKYKEWISRPTNPIFKTFFMSD